MKSKKLLNSSRNNTTTLKTGAGATFSDSSACTIERASMMCLKATVAHKDYRQVRLALQQVTVCTYYVGQARNIVSPIKPTYTSVGMRV